MRGSPNGLFPPITRDAPADERAAPPTVARAPFDHVCFVCGALAPFGRGSLRRGKPMVWACAEHREKLR